MVRITEASYARGHLYSMLQVTCAVLPNEAQHENVVVFVKAALS